MVDAVNHEEPSPVGCPDSEHGGVRGNAVERVRPKVTCPTVGIIVVVEDGKIVVIDEV